MKRLLLVLLLAFLLATGLRPARAATVSPVSVLVLDVTGQPRSTFADTESMGFSQTVFNNVGSSNRIQFTFTILNPAGALVFTQTGNAAPGTPGQAAARVSGVPVHRFWTGPGSYTLVAQASLDGNAISQQASFSISSPLISLLFPPDGSRELPPPLTFRWSGSGGSQFRVLVGADPGFFKLIASLTTSGPQSFLDYPENPSDPLQHLSGGQLYYWKVQSLDAGGNRTAESSVYSFTLRSQASTLSRDLAITGLDLLTTEIGPAGDLMFRVKVKNMGGTSESNIRVTLTVSGLEPPGSPQTIASIAPGEERVYDIGAVFPPDQNNAVAFATVVLQDDNPLNNFRELAVVRPAAKPLAGPATGQFLGEGREREGEDREFSSAASRPKWVWRRVRPALDGSARAELRGYAPVEVQSNLSAEDLKALIKALEKGQATVTRAEVK